MLRGKSWEDVACPAVISESVPLVIHDESLAVLRRVLDIGCGIDSQVFRYVEKTVEVPQVPQYGWLCYRRRNQHLLFSVHSPKKTSLGAEPHVVCNASNID
eukprot:4435584-Amphidinium_carterae.1